MENKTKFSSFASPSGNSRYLTIEEVEANLQNLQDPNLPEDDRDDLSPHLTVLIVHPRTVTLRFADIEVSLADIPYLKKLRQSSWDAMRLIGKPDD